MYECYGRPSPPPRRDTAIHLGSGKPSHIHLKTRRGPLQLCYGCSRRPAAPAPARRRPTRHPRGSQFDASSHLDMHSVSNLPVGCSLPHCPATRALRRPGGVRSCSARVERHLHQSMWACRPRPKMRGDSAAEERLPQAVPPCRGVVRPTLTPWALLPAEHVPPPWYQCP